MKSETTVSASFCMKGDLFPTLLVTDMLNLKPTYVYHKGDVINANLVREDTCWSYGTPFEESWYTSEQLDAVINKLKPHTTLLLQFKEKYALELSFHIVMKMRNNDKPAIYLDKETIHFMSELGASIRHDYYIYSS